MGRYGTNLINDIIVEHPDDDQETPIASHRKKKLIKLQKAQLLLKAPVIKLDGKDQNFIKSTKQSNPDLD